jgi:hypothetical protein
MRRQSGLVVLEPMTNSKIAQEGPPSQKLWLPSLLLLAQFLTIAPVLLIVLANEQQREANQERLSLDLDLWFRGGRCRFIALGRP